jgi:hypothetical protein
MDRTRVWPIVGLAFGIVLGFAGAFGGFSAFIIVLVLGVVGLLAGRALAGEFGLSDLMGSWKQT